uniref:Uncharacterized protein n=1 Tax=Anopheles darlingi TaxID=43151 RepID=A0A2M4CL99_ANODA
MNDAPVCCFCTFCLSTTRLLVRTVLCWFVCCDLFCAYPFPPLLSKCVLFTLCAFFLVFLIIWLLLCFPPLFSLFFFCSVIFTPLYGSIARILA